MSSITITFGDAAENHAGMQKIAINGIIPAPVSVAELRQFEAKFGGLVYDLAANTAFPEAAVWTVPLVNIARDFNAPQLFNMLKTLPWDTRALMRGKVVNKHARYNLCFADAAAEPHYESGRGRIINFADMPALAAIRAKLGELRGDFAGLVAEGNYYYSRKCGIGYHGDSERKITIGLRLDSEPRSHPLIYRWYTDSKQIGADIYIPINNGDLYIMSEKAVGNDWKRRSIYTLRHATGAAKYVIA